MKKLLRSLQPLELICPPKMSLINGATYKPFFSRLPFWLQLVSLFFLFFQLLREIGNGHLHKLEYKCIYFFWYLSFFLWEEKRKSFLKVGLLDIGFERKKMGRIARLMGHIHCYQWLPLDHDRHYWKGLLQGFSTQLIQFDENVFQTMNDCKKISF